VVVVGDGVERGGGGGGGEGLNPTSLVWFRVFKRKIKLRQE
jgi:hypothetical protein